MSQLNPYSILRDLLKATGPFTGMPFLKAASNAFAGQFKADFVFITRRLDTPAETVQMLAACRNGEEVAGWDFILSGTPCALIYEDELSDEWAGMRVGKTVAIAENVCRRFVSTEDTNYQAFIGVPLWSAEREMIGHVAIFFERKLSDDAERTLMFELVELFSLKVQAELNRMLLEQARERVLQELEKVNGQLINDSITDSLTGLYNRRYFTQRLQQAYRRFKRSAEPYALIFLDVDRFKSINDTYGHDAGDTVLYTLANALRENVRAEIELAFRIGGEEFAILCFGPITSEQLTALGKRINHAVNECIFAGDWGTFQIAVSVGAALPKESDAAWNAIYLRADAAMYHVKKYGGDSTLIGE